MFAILEQVSATAKLSQHHFFAPALTDALGHSCAQTHATCLAPPQHTSFIYGEALNSERIAYTVVGVFYGERDMLCFS